MTSRRFHDQIVAGEDGTALTEFVITLPIFVIIFLGIAGLSELQEEATRAHPEANRLMWEQAAQVANSAPSSKWADPSISEYEPFVRGDHDTFGYDEAKFMRLADYGTLGEAMNGATFDESVNWRFVDEDYQQSDCPGCAFDWVYGGELSQTAYAFAATADNRHPWPLPETIRPPIQGMRATFSESAPKSRMAYGAGTRYGIVAGQASRSVEWRGFATTFEPQYQIAAPSRTLEDDGEAFGSVSAARVQMEGHLYGRLLGFEWENYFMPSFWGAW